MYEPKLNHDERIIYYSERHWFWLIKRGRFIYFDHPEADKSDFLFCGNLDNEKSMEHFKASINGMVDVHNSTNVDHRI